MYLYMFILSLRPKILIMIISPCAKINLGLNVVNKRPDGYHDLETVFYPVNICDRIEIKTGTGKSGRCTLNIEGMKVDGDMENNLVVRAYNLLAKDFELPDVCITLYKHIPMQAGMGGGSADCAYTIRLLNEMFNLGLSVEAMQRYAAMLGADCAFFIQAVPAYAEGIGDVLTPVDIDLGGYKIAVVKPDIAVSTKEAFSNIVVSRPKKCCLDVIRQPIDTWRDELYNDFEHSIFPQYPELEAIKEKLYSLGAVYAAMSGSGSAMFGIFRGDMPCIENEFAGCFTAVESL